MGKLKLALSHCCESLIQAISLTLHSADHLSLCRQTNQPKPHQSRNNRVAHLRRRRGAAEVGRFHGSRREHARPLSRQQTNAGPGWRVAMPGCRPDLALYHTTWLMGAA